jgi:uracil-DNA glycosylase
MPLFLTWKLQGENQMDFHIEESWDVALKAEYAKPYFKALNEFICAERKAGKAIYPPKGMVFHALQKTPLSAVKVVIMGQDPYHGQGQAHGLSFSVPAGIRPPPSLQNIFKELSQDVGTHIPTHGCLENWANQGVLLLNAVLTVEEGLPLVHQKRGWERFTDAVVRALALRDEPVIFLLWGRNARDKCLHVQELKENKTHTILTAAHPSPLSAYNGFFGCKHFSQTNEILKTLGKPVIDWQI